MLPSQISNLGPLEFDAVVMRPAHEPRVKRMQMLFGVLAPVSRCMNERQRRRGFTVIRLINNFHCGHPLFSGNEEWSISLYRPN